MNRSIYFNFIREKLSSLANYIGFGGKLNLLDSHIHAEIFFRDFSNLLFGWNLKKTKHHNEPGIDLVDITNRIVVSVSATVTKQKIESSLEKINSKYSGYTFKFISISKDASELRKQTYSNPHTLIFSPITDIFDIPLFLNQIYEMEIDQLREVYEFLKKELDNEIDTITLKPIDRLKTYLHDSGNWKYELGEEQNPIFHYEQFPEFTIVENSSFDEKYDEPWLFQFPDKHFPNRIEYFAKYNGTTLTKIYLVCCDGGRFLTAQPRMWFNHSAQTYYQTYYFIKDSIEYLVAQMITTIEPNNCRAPSIYKEFNIFESEEDANHLIEADFDAGLGMRQYIYYSFDEEARRYSRIEKGIPNPINQQLSN